MTLRIENAAYMDLAAREQWLAAQAARGWYPAGSFFPIWRMKKGPPRTLRYALTPRRDSGALSPEVRALYQQAGWTYVRDAGEFRLFAAEDPAAPPVFTDDDSLACSLRGMERRLWWATTAAGLLLAAVLAALLLPGMTLLRLVSVPVLGWLMLLVSPFQLGAQWRDLHRARRGVRQGGSVSFSRSAAWAADPSEEYLHLAAAAGSGIHAAGGRPAVSPAAVSAGGRYAAPDRGADRHTRRPAAGGAGRYAAPSAAHPAVSGAADGHPICV